MKKVIEFLIFITFKSLLLLAKINSDDISIRCINTVSIILCNVFFVVFGTIYMILISNKIVFFNKMFFWGFTICFCVTIFISMHKSYLEHYSYIIKKLDKSYKYSNIKYLMLFLVSFLTPILMIGIGLSILREFLYFH